MLLQRTKETLAGAYSFSYDINQALVPATNLAPGAIGSYDLKVPIPKFSVITEFVVSVQTLLASGGAATVSFDLINIDSGANSVGALLAASAYNAASVFTPVNNAYNGKPALPLNSAVVFVPYNASIGCSIATAALTAGFIRFYARIVTFDL